MYNTLSLDSLSLFSEKELAFMETPVAEDNEPIFPLLSAGDEVLFDSGMDLIDDFCDKFELPDNNQFSPKSNQGVCLTEEEDELVFRFALSSSDQEKVERKIVCEIIGSDQSLSTPEISNISENEEAKTKTLSDLPEEDIKVDSSSEGKGTKTKIQVINAHNLKRHDVVLKSILRKMKRDFFQQFLDATNYQKKEKQSKVRMANLVNGANRMVSEMDLPILPNNYCFYYLAVTCPGELRKALNHTDVIPSHQAMLTKAYKVINLIDSVMNRFSKRIFNQFMEIPEISALVHHYLRSEDYLEDCEGFAPCISILDAKSKEVMNRYSNNQDSFESNQYWIKESFEIFRS